jgi:hypothetical protein
MSLDLWFAGVEHRYSGRRWRSNGFVSMDRERRRTNAGTWPRNQRSWVTNHSGWHLGHTHAWTCGRADRVAGTVEDWRDSGPGCGGRACGALLTEVLGLSLKTIQLLVFAEFGLKTLWWWFRRESKVVRGFIVKGVSRRNNFVWSAWPSDQYPRSWSNCPRWNG